MQHETATVKKVIKRYSTKDGEKESISYTAKLKGDSEFNDGDIVAVIPIDEVGAVADIDVAEIQNLKDVAADKDETIAANTETIDKLNAELQNKFNLINDITAKLKASEKTVAELESDISANGDTIAELTSDVKVADATIKNLENTVADKDAELVAVKDSSTDKDKTIAELSAKNDALHERLDELTDLLDGKDTTIAALDETVAEYKIKVAEFNAIDVDKLKEKADKSDVVKDELIEITKKLDSKSNVISLLQNQIMELQQLVNYKDKEIDAVKNQNVIHKLLRKDATVDIPTPTLYLIDTSGNLIKNADNDISVDAEIDDDDSGETN